MALAYRGMSQAISIHAPREGSDAHDHLRDARCVDFNPRSP